MSESKAIFTLHERMISPTFIASGDIHLGHKLYNIPDLEEDLRDNFVRLCDLAIAKNVQYLIIAGDLFDDNLPRPNTVAFVKEQSRRLYEAGIDLIGIAGDHDKPISGQSWCAVSDVKPVHTCPCMVGLDYYDYANGGTEGVMTRLLDTVKRNGIPAEDILWVVLHCQFPQIYQFTEAKKKVDFGEVKLFDAFPNLQGVLAGDIHTPLEGTLIEKEREAYIGYCGSLGVIDISEAKQTKSVFYCDGTTLTRLPFVQRRSFVRINFKGDKHKSFDVSGYLKQYEAEAYKPVFCVDYDADSEPFLKLIKPLYNIGFVRTSQAIRSMKTGQEEVINIRSEIKTDEKIEQALTDCCEGDQQIYSLLSETLTSADPKSLLDVFKEKALA